jgi:hypothetical protein
VLHASDAGEKKSESESELRTHITPQNSTETAQNIARTHAPLEGAGEKMRSRKRGGTKRMCLEIGTVSVAMGEDAHTQQYSELNGTATRQTKQIRSFQWAQRARARYTESSARDRGAKREALGGGN